MTAALQRRQPNRIACQPADDALQVTRHKVHEDSSLLHEFRTRSATPVQPLNQIHGLVEAFVVVASNKSETHGLAFTALQSDSTLLLWPLAIADTQDRNDIEAALLDSVSELGDEHQSWFIQSLHTEATLAERLTQHDDFEHIADLDLMACRVPVLGASEPQAPAAHQPRKVRDQREPSITTFGQSTSTHLGARRSQERSLNPVTLIDETNADFLRAYVESQRGSFDCTALAGHRPPTADLQSFRELNAFDPNCWFLFKHNNEPVALLLLTPVDPQNKVWEVIYIGVSHKHRRQGWARHAMTFALESAAQRGADFLTLAVDQANEPAKRLYDSLGFFVHGSLHAVGRLRRES